MSNSWQENLYAFKDDEQISLELNYFWVLHLYNEKEKTTWNCWERKKEKQVRKEERNLFTQALIYSSVIITSVSCCSVKLNFIRLTKQRGKLNLSYPTEGGFCHSAAACLSRNCIFSLLLSSHSSLGEFGSYNISQIDSNTSLILKKIAFYLLLWSTVHTLFYTTTPMKTANISPASQDKSISPWWKKVIEMSRGIQQKWRKWWNCGWNPTYRKLITCATIT